MAYLKIVRSRYARQFGISERRANEVTAGLDAEAVIALLSDPKHQPPTRPKRSNRPPIPADAIALLNRWRQANQGKPATMPWLYSIRERGRLDFHLDRARAWSATQS
jgi:hypothetical protein